ncbi:MAG TPA: DUF3617 domain-containing protein [Ramlibacter sp.]|uniref:DUF3617 domain-containing protein n=1 Tax=Ramlibacter sp. TaxID=1917967 RepID=UPI002ED049AD
MRIPSLIACGVLAAACLPASAQSMKPGLWEIHNKMQGGEMDAAMAQMQQQMAQMSPAERKQMEAMMGKQGVRMAPSGGAMAVQVCMTKEMVERNDPPMQDGCKVTRNQRSGNTHKFAFACSNPPSSGEGQVSYQGPEAYTSRMTVKSTTGGKTDTTTMEGSGKWLKADCGSVKPMQAPKK